MKDIRIEVIDTKLNVLKGTSKKTGRDYEMAFQRVYVHDINHYPVAADILAPDTGAYSKGMYLIDMPSSIDIYNNRISFRPVLVLPQK